MPTKTELVHEIIHDGYRPVLLVGVYYPLDA